MGRGSRPAALCDQRPELRPLQNLRYQRPEPEHHLGSARRRRRAQLSEYVIAAPTRGVDRRFEMAKYRNGARRDRRCSRGTHRPNFAPRFCRRWGLGSRAAGEYLLGTAEFVCLRAWGKKYILATTEHNRRA